MELSAVTDEDLLNVQAEPRQDQEPVVLVVVVVRASAEEVRHAESLQVSPGHPLVDCNT